MEREDPEKSVEIRRWLRDEDDDDDTTESLGKKTLLRTGGPKSLSQREGAMVVVMQHFVSCCCEAKGVWNSLCAESLKYITCIDAMIKD